ncbi:hypothetical protein N9R04_03970 [Staphylococcus sp. SQ8-PEA]|uniref:DUF1270 family protein n=1 Tax=Staphylococcus marylandisciuri TaxID=2981529 RepID=A0ABT2QPH4_9STAP|nr:hypothetical protein [Staphylococcus marylandisciuri]MCU5745879.1 hypothetical protein [Staphylococcus marylandisciuri]
MKSFLIANAMFVVTSLIFALLLNDAIKGVACGALLAMMTYLFFSDHFFQIKKD